MTSSSSSLPSLPPEFAAALQLIDDAHAEDPRKIPDPSRNNNNNSNNGGHDGDRGEGEGDTVAEIPYELHYARQMTRWLAVRCPDASPALQLACRAQHFRRWEIPRQTYPMTRKGYLSWRAKQKSQAALQVYALLLSSSASSSSASLPTSTSTSPPSSSSPTPSPSSSSSPIIPEPAASRVAALIRKEGLAAEDPEAQALEDAACLVFLNDQLDGFVVASENVDEDKAIGILRKTWAKMSPRGREIALGMELSGRARGLVERALEEDA
ncbi:glutamyl-tRNA synthetase [Xylariomycetidae sp. FL2044]|nr:glutamyl-tRNA synthetase [Xylariomycetidae sp. FL2044]